MQGKNMKTTTFSRKTSYGHNEQVQKSLQSWPWPDIRQSKDWFQGGLWFEM